MMIGALLAIVALNQDPSQFQLSGGPEKMTEAGAKEYYDTVAKEAVTHFLICPNAHNVVYESKVWDSLWHDGSAQGLVCNAKNKWMTNSKLLVERGVDYIEVWIKRSRERSISPWLTMRMNDVHCMDKAETTWRSKFWCEHPEFRRVPGNEGSTWSSAALDYSHKEVQDRAIALVKEMLEKWDVDGFECDWLRFPHHFPIEMELAKTGHPHLTRVMREVKRLVSEQEKRRGHRILVGARVASRPENALGLGTDAETWAKEGLIDWLVPCNFFDTSDFALPMEDWVRRIHAVNPKVKVLAGCDFAGVVRDGTSNLSPVGITLAEVAGYYERLVEGGAQGAYYFNKFEYYPQCSVSEFVQRKGVPMDGEKLRKMDRAYPVTTFLDAVPGKRLGDRLWVAASKGGEFTIPIGKAGRLERARVRVLYTGKVAQEKAVVALNDSVPTGVKAIDAIKWTEYTKDKREMSAYEFEFAAAAVKDGENKVKVAPIEGSKETIAACELYLDAVTK